MKKNHFKQHIPNYMEGFDIWETAFDTLEELLASDYMKRWANYPEFHQFSLSDNCLMAELNKGFNWRVAGYIKYPELIDLPKWQLAFSKN